MSFTDGRRCSYQPFGTVLWPNDIDDHLGPTITEISLLQYPPPKLAIVSPGAFQNQSTRQTLETSQSGIPLFVLPSVCGARQIGGHLRKDLDLE